MTLSQIGQGGRNRSYLAQDILTGGEKKIRLLEIAQENAQKYNQKLSVLKQWEDELFPDAVNLVLEMGGASVSVLQDGLRIGYARAARIIDEMEELNIVGPFQGIKPGQILITKDQWNHSRRL